MMIKKILHALLLPCLVTNIMAATIESTEFEDFDTTLQRAIQPVMAQFVEEVKPLFDFINTLREEHEKSSHALKCLETAENLYGWTDTGLRMLKNVHRPQYSGETYDQFMKILEAQFLVFDRYGATTVNRVDVFSTKAETRTTISLGVNLNKEIYPFNCPTDNPNPIIFGISRSTLGFTDFTVDTAEENIDAKLDAAISIVDKWKEEAAQSLSAVRRFEEYITEKLNHNESEFTRKINFIATMFDRDAHLRAVERLSAAVLRA